MSTAILEASTSTPSISVSPTWIIDKREDLIWFIGSALTGYLALAIVSGLQHKASIAVLSFVWGILISGPHFFATATRTYLDGDQRKKLSGFLWLIFPLSLVPLIIFTVGGKAFLFVFATGWGTFHIAKQHLGIVMLYKRVNDEREKTDFRIDKWFLLASQILPLALFLLWYLSLPARGILFTVALAIQLLLLVGYAYRQVVKYGRGQEMNWPKLMLLALVIPLHWLAFICASNDPIKGIFIFTIAINIGHALQYHRLTWFHNRNRYFGKPGLSGLLSRRVIYYYIAALGLYLFFILIAPSLLPFRAGEYILMAPVFMHYLLDARIWRVREDPELARALNLS